MRDQTQQPPADQFLPVEEAARSVNLSGKVLRQGIACGLVPIRQDNTGAIRIHVAEIPPDLERRLNDGEVQPQLQIATLADEVSHLEKSKADVESQRARLEALVIKQGAALSRYAEALGGSDVGDANLPAAAQGTPNKLQQQLARRDAEVQQLTQLLDRTFKAIDARDRQVVEQSVQLSSTTDKALSLLERAVREGELTAEQLNSLNQQLSSSATTTARLEQELDERNSIINNQHGLMERMVTLAEQTALDTSSGSLAGSSTTTRRKRSLWQRLQLRLWGGGKGI